MKKRSKVLAVLLCAAMAFTAGCGSKAEGGAGTEAKEETSESNEYLSLIQEAYEQYKAEAVHGYISENTQKREDGSSEVYTMVFTIDQGKQQVLDKTIWSDGDEYTYYVTKEGENDYYYTETTTFSDDTGETTKEYYKVLSTGQDYSTYSYYTGNEKGKRYESNEYYDISNVNVSDEGEEELDGVQVQKFIVEYDSQWKGREETTRESLLKEYEWTEEDVAQLEGMSDVIDAYIEESNAQLKKDMDEVEKVTEIVYLASEDNKLVRMETERAYEDTDMPASEAFWDMSGKLSYLKDLLSEGIGKDEAMGIVNEAYGDMGMEEESPLVSYSSVTDYQTGDGCEPIELPADAKELTWEQWQNGEY